MAINMKSDLIVLFHFQLKTFSAYKVCHQQGLETLMFFLEHPLLCSRKLKDTVLLFVLNVQYEANSEAHQ